MKPHIFHLSLLDHYSLPGIGQPFPNQILEIVEESEKWVVDHILHSRWPNWKLHYLIKQAGYNHIHMSRKPVEYLYIAPAQDEKIQQEQSDRPWNRRMESRNDDTENPAGVWTFHVRCCVFILMTCDWILAQYYWHRHMFRYLAIDTEFAIGPNAPNGCYCALPSGCETFG